MTTDIIQMIRVILWRLHHPVELRQKYIGESQLVRFFQPFRMLRNDHLRKLSTDPFCTDILQELCLIAHRFPRLIFNYKIKLCRKPDCTQDTKCILVEPF